MNDNIEEERRLFGEIYQIVAQAKRDREAKTLELLDQINAEIVLVNKRNAELLAQVNYLKGQIDGMEKICEK